MIEYKSLVRAIGLQGKEFEVADTVWPAVKNLERRRGQAHEAFCIQDYWEGTLGRSEGEALGAAIALLSVWPWEHNSFTFMWFESQSELFGNIWNDCGTELWED